MLSVPESIWALLIAALLGFLIGLERERKREMRGSIFAGIRTFPLIALFGAVSGMLALVTPWVLVAALLGFSALLVFAYWRASAGEKVGGTTEVAAFVTFGLGVLAGQGEFVTALAGAVITTGILSLRQELHSLAGSIRQEDLFATVQLAVVSIIVLPLVPDENFGPWGVWNPRTIWLLVVFISAISFVGYLAAKLVGARRGTLVSGILGGLASSTAVTASFSERSRENAALGPLLTVGVLAASAVMVPRFLVLLGVVQPQLILGVLLPFGVLFLATGLAALILYRRSRRDQVAQLELANPFELRSALQFAVVFAVILLLARAASEAFGAGGIYLASLISGLVRPDAIILTLGQQASVGLAPEVAVRGLALAAASNTFFKGLLAYSLGSQSFGRSVFTVLAVASVACLAVAWLVPADWLAGALAGVGE
jgi:uncharacterized membrane protein (DUF4010 family)